MSSDSDALLATVLKFPADDTARLVLADWLDEHAGTVPCPECGATGSCYELSGRKVQCARCRGTQTVSNGFAERAEFIRVQAFGRGLLGTAQACPHCVDGARLGDVGTGAPPRCTECCGTGSRYAREWSGIPCPACEGKGWIVGPPGGRACRLCGDNTTNNGTGFAPVEFRRGFVERVCCRMEDVLRREVVASVYEHPPEYEWRLTPWARSVLAAHPVTRWEITDIDDNPPGRDSLMIWLGIQYAESGGRIADNEPFPRCVGRVARRLAGLPEVTP